MPSYKVHLLAGAFIYVIMAKLMVHFSLLNSFDLKDYVLALGLTLLGAIFPDIDTFSKMQKIFWRLMLLLIPLTLFYNHLFFIGVCLLCIWILFLTHRTITHNLWFLIIFPIIVATGIIYYHPHTQTKTFSLCIFFTIGALSHRLLDFGFYRFFSKK